MCYAKPATIFFSARVPARMFRTHPPGPLLVPRHVGPQIVYCLVKARKACRISAQPREYLIFQHLFQLGRRHAHRRDRKERLPARDRYNPGIADEQQRAFTSGVISPLSPPVADAPDVLAGQAR